MRRWRIFTVVAVTLAAHALFAHEVRPAYLDLRQTAANTYTVLWKVPAVGDMRLSIHPRLPENCNPAGHVASYPASDSHPEPFTLGAPSALNGGRRPSDGLARTSEICFGTSGGARRS